MSLQQIMGMLQQMQEGQQQQLGMMQDRPMLKPRMGIPRAAAAGPEWKIRSNPNYKPYDPTSDRQYGAVNSTGQRVGSWRDDKTPAIGKTGPNGYQAYGPNGPPPQSTQTPAAGPAGAVSPKTQSAGGGLMGLIGGLFGGGQQSPQQPQAPQGPRVNSLTGLPFGTMPGDPAYQAMQDGQGPMGPPASAQMSPKGQAAMDAYSKVIQSGSLDAFAQAREMMNQRNSEQFPNSPAIGMQPQASQFPGLNAPAGMQYPQPSQVPPVVPEWQKPRQPTQLDGETFTPIQNSMGQFYQDQRGNTYGQDPSKATGYQRGSVPIADMINDDISSVLSAFGQLPSNIASTYQQQQKQVPEGNALYGVPTAVLDGFMKLLTGGQNLGDIRMRY